MSTQTPAGNTVEYDLLLRAMELKDSNNYVDRLVAITAFAFPSGKYVSKSAETHLKTLASDPVPAVAEFAKEALNRCNLMP
ncbi:TPA: hypothetical protein N3282_001401 [Klebsiella aerogenes]|nr:hypothetical protein [Klebsiella aerogenes]